MMTIDTSPPSYIQLISLRLFINQSFSLNSPFLMFHYFISLPSNVTHSIPVSFNSISVSCLNQTSTIHFSLSICDFQLFCSHSLSVYRPSLFHFFRHLCFSFFFLIRFLSLLLFALSLSLFSLYLAGIFRHFLQTFNISPISSNLLRSRLHPSSFSFVFSYSHLYLSLSLSRARAFTVFSSHFLLLSVAVVPTTLYFSTSIDSWALFRVKDSCFKLVSSLSSNACYCYFTLSVILFRQNPSLTYYLDYILILF